MIDVNRLKDLNRIEDVVEMFEGFKLDRRGRGKHWRGVVHDSFVVNVDEQLYFWNARGRGGDVVSFLEQECGMSFIDACRWLADRARVELDLDPATAKRWAAIRKRQDALTVVMEHLEKLLPGNDVAVGYCRSRGWTDVTIGAARLGFWDGDGGALRAHCELHDVDVLSGPVQAVLRMPPNMLVYGHWVGDRCVYVSGRGIGVKRHWNGPRDLVGERELFWNHVRMRGSVVVVEGQADAVSLGQLGVPAVGLCGLGVGDLPQLARMLADVKVFLALDMDEAGQRLVADFARVLGPTTRVVSWPGGKDANEALLGGMDERGVKRVLAEAPPFVVLLARMAAEGPPMEVDVRRRAALEVAALLDDVEMALWRDDLRKLLGLSVGSMNAAIKALRSEAATVVERSPEVRAERVAAAADDEHEVLVRGKLLGEPGDHEGHMACVLARHADEFLFVPEWGWMCYEGGRFVRHGAEARVERAIIETLRERMRLAEMSQLDDLAKSCAANYHTMTGVKGVLRSRVAAKTGDFDAAADLLNVKNGVLNLRTGELVPHEPGHRFTYCLDVAYDRSALDDERCTLWLSWLFEVLEQEDVAETEELVEWLQEVVGYSLTGHTSEELFLFMHGPSRSGKGTLAETLMALLGQPLATEVVMETFAGERGGDTNNFDLAPLHASRLIFADETAAHKRLNSTHIKQLTGGGQVYASFKGKDHFNYKPQYTIWMASNWPLNMNADDEAAWGRARVVPFHRSWLGKEDRGLKRRMQGKRNLEAVLAWAVEGARRWFERGRLEVPAAVARTTKMHREEQDMVELWLVQNAEVADPDDMSVFTPLDLLMPNYRDWCKEAGIRAKGIASFRQAMEAKGYERKRKRHPMYKNARWGYFGVLLEGHAKDGGEQDEMAL